VLRLVFWNFRSSKASKEQRFWSQEHGLYADEATGDWETLFPYRGQNAKHFSAVGLSAWASDRVGEGVDHP
jgi:hypothetical protein